MQWEAEEVRFRKSLEVMAYLGIVPLHNTVGYLADGYLYVLQGFDLSGPPPIFPGNVANVYIGTPIWEGGRCRMEEAA